MNPSVCNDDNIVANDPDLFDKHFASIGSHIQAQVPQFNNVSYTDFLPPRNSSATTFENFHDISCGEILAYVESLPREKAIFDTIN